MKRPRDMAWRAAATPGLRTLHRFAQARGGGIAVMAAIFVPLLCVLACGAIDLSSVSADHSAMQDVADATALAAAKELGMTSASGIAAQARENAESQLTDVARRVAFTVSTTVADDGASVTVAINGSRPSFFDNLLPLGGWKLNVQATAQSVGEVPLCVLATGAQRNGGIQLNASSATTAANCLVQSNGDIQVTGSSTLQAGMVQAAGTVQGTTTPAAQAGAPAIADPLPASAWSRPRRAVRLTTSPI
jgi:Flp pilus assembly protein TadG